MKHIKKFVLLTIGTTLLAACGGSDEVVVDDVVQRYVNLVSTLSGPFEQDFQVSEDFAGYYNGCGSSSSPNAESVQRNVTESNNAYFCQQASGPEICHYPGDSSIRTVFEDFSGGVSSEVLKILNGEIWSGVRVETSQRFWIGFSMPSESCDGFGDDPAERAEQDLDGLWVGSLVATDSEGVPRTLSEVQFSCSAQACSGDISATDIVLNPDKRILIGSIEIQGGSYRLAAATSKNKSEATLLGCPEGVSPLDVTTQCFIIAARK